MTRPTSNAFLLIATVLFAAWLAEGVASAQVFVRFKARHSNKCLDVTGASTATGASIVQFTCSSSLSQRWAYVTMPGGSSALMNQNSGLCLDVPGGSTASGVGLWQYPCNGTPAQRFTFTNFGWWWRIANVGSGLCLDVAGISTANGAVVQQFGCHLDDNQLWTSN